jgi:F0F1-type ATP synthase membrane subunit c/vacuolar-type H+-ATPase subunit K
MADRAVLLGVAGIGVGVAVIGFGAAIIGPAAVMSAARRLAESVTKAPVESEGQDSQETTPGD